MSFTYDPTTNIGLVRLRIRDKDSSDFLFTDEELSAVLLTEGNIWKRGAALCLETIATNEALIQKVIKMLQLSTDGAKLADSLMKQAAELRKQADDEDAFTGDAFDWAEHVYNPATEDERLLKQILRGLP